MIGSEGTFLNKVSTTFKNNPVFCVASTALTGIAGAGLYGLKNRKLRLSLYLINVRLAAQGTFVAIMTVGATAALVKRVMYPEETNSNVNKRW